MPGAEGIRRPIRNHACPTLLLVEVMLELGHAPREPGDMRTVSLEIPRDSLAFYDINMDYVVESGEFEITIGSLSRHAALRRVFVAGRMTQRRPARCFFSTPNRHFR